MVVLWQTRDVGQGAKELQQEIAAAGALLFSFLSFHSSSPSSLFSFPFLYLSHSCLKSSATELLCNANACLKSQLWQF